MKSLNFEEVIGLINKSRVTEIDIKPITIEKGKWAIFKGVNKVPNFSYPFNILYLYSDFTKDAISRAVRSINNPETTQVVYAQSLKSNYIDELKQNLKRSKKTLAGVVDLKTYLLSFIQEQLGSYIDKLKESKPKIFIDPSYETPSGNHRKFPNPLEIFFSDNSEDVNDGALAVLLAEPGQGKTYTAQYLTNALIDRGFIPIYIHSVQWATMQEGDLSSIYKTIMHSFRYNNAPIEWIDGEEERFINITLKVGIFRIIFDGFDEYILWNNGNVSADDTIYALHELVKSSEARVLVTSRTTFWNASITNEVHLSTLFKYSILPFDLNHAKNYFSKRFPDTEKPKEKSIKVFKMLSGSGASHLKKSFAGRGIILSLVADLCSDDIDVSSYDDKFSIWQWIIYALCQREELRQKLNDETLKLNADSQLKILRMFVEEKTKGIPQTSSLLGDIISLFYENKNENEINKIILSLLGDNNSRGKLADHPLITKDFQTGNWHFRHEQIEFNLIAELLIGYAKDRDTRSINKFFEEVKAQGSYLDDLAIVMIEQLNVLSDKHLDPDMELFATLKSCLPSNITKSHDSSNLSIVLTKILYSYLNKLYPIDHSDKQARIKELLNLLDRDHISGYHFTGKLASIDFSGIVFMNCVFENTLWANCKFSSSTTFKACRFIGGEVHNCENFGDSAFEADCDLDANADVLISYEKIKYNKKKIDRKDIKRDIVFFIKKFVPRDSIFNNVYDDGLFKGYLAISPYKTELVRVMKKFIINENNDDSGHYYYIRPESKESIRHYFNNGVFSMELAQAYNELIRKLGID